MANNHKNGTVGNYILVALILGVITYVEFAIVEYPQAWLGQTMTLVVLAALSVLKFILVVMFFMHLKGDDRMYSGFFTSGMVIALATFIAMTAMFILPRAMSYGESRERAETLEGGGIAHGEAHVPPEVEELITTDGRSRSAADRADVPPAANRSSPIEAPLAANDASTYAVEGAEGPAPAQTAEGEETEDGEVAGSESAEEAAAESDLGPRPETEADDDLQAEPEADEAEETAADDAEAADHAIYIDAADGVVCLSGSVESLSHRRLAEDDAAAKEPAGDVAAVDWDRELGAQVYNANCVGCHQAAGQGVPGAFPPLAGHASEVYAAGGEDYLAQVLLFGLTGQIQVEGTSYNGFMPAWQQLDDDQIANVLNHVIAELGDAPSGFVPYMAADVAEHRDDSLSAGDVHSNRAELGLE